MFTHLHLHTKFSVLDGVIKIPKLVKKLKDLQMTSCAITDHGTMHGVYKFYEALKKENLKPIIGCEAYTTSGSRFEKDKNINHLVLLCQNKEGYENLSKLLTKAHLEGFYRRPRMDKEILEKYSSGIIALSACLQGEIPKLLNQNKIEKAKSTAKWYKDVFENRFYLELQDNGIDEQYGVNKKLINLSKELDIPLVATNDCHYIDKKDAFVQDVLICVSTKKTLKDEKRMKIHTDELYLKSEKEMKKGFFKDYPEAISNTQKIVEECDFSFKTGVHYLPVMGNSEEESKKILEEKAWDGLKNLNIASDKKKTYEDRLNYELKIIKDMGFSSYYLIVADFISWAKEKDIPVGPGRGSGAASLAGYAIGITSLDPIKYDLIFERFLNPERVSLPDFDIDFCSRRRDEVIEYIMEKYGDEKTAKIATFGLLKPRGSVKDVGRVLGYDFKETNKMSKLIAGDAKDLLEAYEKNPDLKKLANMTKENKEIFRLAEAVEGSVRSIGCHAGGVIISSKNICDLTPLTRTKEKVIATQLDMKDLESVGLVKFDLLAIENLTIIDDAEKIIRKYRDENFNIENISLNDTKVYSLLAKGDTMGVFQLESLGMQRLLKEIVPDKFEDIIAVNALYRPGPLNGGTVDTYIARRHGKEEVKYSFKELEPILKETHGIIIYQEQVQRIASTLAGYSLGEADLLRRAMGKKKVKEMQLHKEKFVKGAIKKGHDKKKAEELFFLMAKFAEYGFNKAHAAVYALNAYRTAYLKTYYPVEFMSALLTAKSSKKTEVLIPYISDAISHNIKVLNPNINESLDKFEPEGKNIRYGFVGVEDLGGAAIDSILEERAENGLYKSFSDFCLRIDTRKITKRVLEQLVKSGAFDCFGINRGILFNNVDRVIIKASKRREEKEKGQGNLFLDGENGSKEEKSFLDFNVEAWDENQILEKEKESLGVFISSHPADNYFNLLKNVLKNSESIKNSPTGDNVTCIGVLSFEKEIKTKEGKTILHIFNLEDRYGKIELLAYEKTLKNISKSFYLNSIVPAICFGKITSDKKRKENKVVIEKIKAIDETKLMLEIKVNSKEFAKDKIKSILEPINEIKNKGFVTFNLKITYPYEGEVSFEKNNLNMDMCKLLIDNFKSLNKKTNYKWDFK
jgi:DNA polymerase III subunit alpha